MSSTKLHLNLLSIFGNGRMKQQAIQKPGLISSTQRRGRGRGERETLLLNLFLHDVNVAAGGHVDLNLTLPTHF